jgi:hypothetical protein
MDCTGIGPTLAALVRVTLGLRCITEFRITAAIPAKQSSRTAVNKAGTLKSPLPRYSGDWTSPPPMVRASAGRMRWLVTETINPQIPSARITAITTRPIHLPVSAADDSGESVLGTSSIKLCDANCATAAQLGEGSKIARCVSSGKIRLVSTRASSPVQSPPCPTD